METTRNVNELTFRKSNFVHAAKNTLATEVLVRDREAVCLLRNPWSGVLTQIASASYNREGETTVAQTTPVKGKRFTIATDRLGPGKTKTIRWSDDAVGHVWGFTAQPLAVVGEQLIDPDGGNEQIEITRVVFWADHHEGNRGYRITLKNGGTRWCNYVLTGVVFVPV